MKASPATVGLSSDLAQREALHTWTGRLLIASDEHYRPIAAEACPCSSGKPRDTNKPVQPILLSSLSHLCLVSHALMHHGPE